MLLLKERNPRAEPLALGDAYPRLLLGSPRRLSLSTHDPIHTYTYTQRMSNTCITHTTPRFLPHNPTFTLFSF